VAIDAINGAVLAFDRLAEITTNAVKILNTLTCLFLSKLRPSPSDITELLQS
jgi:hypothetical protein